MISRVFAILALVLAIVGTQALITFNPLRAAVSQASAQGVTSMLYVPDGLTREEWERMRKEESAKKANLGKVGTTKFKSRSLKAWQEAGGNHLFPVDPQLVKAGKIPLSKVPYMQRGGSWDDSDLVGKEKGIQKKQWSKSDMEYENGGERANQSINIFGRGANLPWQGRAFDKNDNRNRVDAQKKFARAVTNLPPNQKALERRQKELAELEKKKKLEAQIEKEGGRQKIAPFRFW